MQCLSIKEIKNGKCTTNNVIGYMGGDITDSSPKAYGVFYLETNAKPPYVISDYRNFTRIRAIPYDTMELIVGRFRKRKQKNTTSEYEFVEITKM